MDYATFVVMGFGYAALIAAIIFGVSFLTVCVLGHIGLCGGIPPITKRVD